MFGLVDKLDWYTGNSHLVCDSGVVDLEAMVRSKYWQKFGLTWYQFNPCNAYSRSR